MGQMTPIRLCLAAAAGLAAPTADLAASTVLKMTEHEMAGRAGFIVHGTVTDMRSAWNDDRTQIFTLIDVAVIEQVKGPPLNGTLQLRVLGGLVDDVGMAIIGGPSFEVGRETVLFVDANPHALFPIVGLGQGKLDVRVDAGSGRQMVEGRGIDVAHYLAGIRSCLEGQVIEWRDQGDGVAGGAADPGFRLEGLPDSGLPVTSTIKHPTDPPPFLHWDLREFPDCTIPFSFYDGTDDVGPLLVEFDEVTAAFETWEAVTSAVIRFRRAPPAAGAACPLVKDQHNMIGWNGINCMTVGDDVATTVIGDDLLPDGTLTCGHPVAPGAFFIYAGPNGVLETVPNNCPCADPLLPADDVVAPDPLLGLPAIRDGGNGRIDTARHGDCYSPTVAGFTLATAGPDGWMTTSPNNCCDDKIAIDEQTGSMVIVDGGNGIRETLAFGPQDQPSGVGAPISPFCPVTPGQILVMPVPGFVGPNNQCDDFSLTLADGSQTISDGIDGIVTTDPRVSLPGGTLALTGVFYEGPREGGPRSGRILEADILFNDLSYTWGALAAGVAMAGTPDVQTVALHEIGHFIGLHHPSEIAFANPPGPIMNGLLDVTSPAGSTTNHALAAADENGIRFLYTPDLGDAPDPPYLSRVHGAGPSGRVLNGLALTERGDGPVHLFGHPPAEYERLGPVTSGECEAFQPPGADSSDDGVSAYAGIVLGGAPEIVLAPGNNTISVTIQYSPERAYNNQPEEMLYLNGYIDSTGFGIFHLITRAFTWAGTDTATEFSENLLSATFDAEKHEIGLQFSYFIGEPFPRATWMRVRLDYGEDEGSVVLNQTGKFGGLSGDLGVAGGAAQFGEVEDYRVRVSACDGDADGDGIVGVIDLLIVLAQWGPGITSPADFNGDFQVGLADLLIVLGNWGPCNPTPRAAGGGSDA